MLKELHGDKSKIDACTILKGNLGMNVTDDEFEYYTVVRKSVLSVRLPEETFRGVFNVLRAYEVSTPKDEVEKALVSDQNNIKSLKITSFFQKFVKFVHNNISQRGF